MSTVTIYEVIDSSDGEVLRASHQRDRAAAWLDNERKDSTVDMALRMRVLEDVEPAIAALAAHLDVSPDAIEPCRGSGDTYEVSDEPGEYRVLTEGERDTAASEALDSYIDDCLEIPASIEPYFDRDKWKRDALMSDGYGHTLSPYDGEEHEEKVDGEWLFIYRVN